MRNAFDLVTLFFFFELFSYVQSINIVQIGAYVISIRVPALAFQVLMVPIVTPIGLG